MEQREIIARGFIAALCRAMEKDDENPDMIPYWDDMGDEEKDAAYKTADELMDEFPCLAFVKR